MDDKGQKQGKRSKKRPEDSKRWSKAADQRSMNWQHVTLRALSRVALSAAVLRHREECRGGRCPDVVQRPAGSGAGAAAHAPRRQRGGHPHQGRPASGGCSGPKTEIHGVAIWWAPFWQISTPNHPPLGGSTHPRAQPKTTRNGQKTMQNPLPNPASSWPDP